mmetsp:Transcript_29354/g.44434  ORF Transcript_29354/g.44434 Transcript_29354/m.44434 type:complete len:211 (-) Transcript_29354:452-1084(-)
MSKTLRLSKKLIPQTVEILTGSEEGEKGKTHSLTKKMVKVRLALSGLLVSRMHKNVRVLNDSSLEDIDVDADAGNNAENKVLDMAEFSGISIAMDDIVDAISLKHEMKLSLEENYTVRNFQFAPSGNVAWVRLEKELDELDAVKAGFVTILGRKCQVALIPKSLAKTRKDGEDFENPVPNDQVWSAGAKGLKQNNRWKLTPPKAKRSRFG